jgi:hypothetical protein
MSVDIHIRTRWKRAGTVSWCLVAWFICFFVFFISFCKTLSRGSDNDLELCPGSVGGSRGCFPRSLAIHSGGEGLGHPARDHLLCVPLLRDAWHPSHAQINATDRKIVCSSRWHSAKRGAAWQHLGKPAVYVVCLFIRDSRQRYSIKAWRSIFWLGTRQRNYGWSRINEMHAWQEYTSLVEKRPSIPVCKGH